MKSFTQRRLHAFVRHNIPSLYSDLAANPALEQYLSEFGHWMYQQREQALRDTIEQHQATSFPELLSLCRQASHASVAIGLELLQAELTAREQSAGANQRLTVNS